MTATRTCLRALLAALLVLVASVAVAPTARAEDGLTIDVTITDVSTPVLDLSDPEQVVEISGTIINTSATRVRYVAINFWQSSDPITTDDELAAAIDSAPMVPLGERTEPWSEESGHIQVITRGNDEWFEPGDRATFKVHATVADLALPTDEAVYRLGVHVRGIPEAGDGNVTVGRGRILVVASQDALEIAPVVKLAAAPTRLATGEFVDDSLLTDIEGRLGQLLDTAETDGTTVLLDPSLLAEATALGEPHVVGDEEHEGHESAADWARRARALATDGDALRLPFANPDIPRTVAQDNLAQVMDWQATAVASEPTRSLPLAVDLGEGATDADTARLGQFGIGTIFADNVIGEGTGTGGIVGVDQIEQTGMGPGGRDSDAQHLTRRLAEEFVAESPRVYLLRTPADVAALGTLEHNTLVPVPDNGGGTAQFAPTAQVPQPRLELLAQLEEIRSRAQFLQDLTGESDPELLDVLSAKASSSGFVDEAAAIAYVDAHPLATVDTNQVTITAAQQLVMGSRTNDFPVTVTNGLDFPVTVRLVFDSASPQRIHVPPTDFVTIDPGQNLSVNISPEATSNGVVAVEASLQTRGEENFGLPVTMEITATNLGSVGWIIIIVSGVVVLGGTFLRIRAVQREKAKHGDAPDQAPVVE
ncbi:hypothetical protein GCM10028820_01280 [Tessaracoccus terricola]